MLGTQVHDESIPSSELIQKKDEGDTSLGRLPIELVPINYNLELRPDIYTGSPPFLFGGSVDIRFRCVDVTGIVYLNSVGLVIESVNISIAADSPVTGPDPIPIRWELDDGLEFFKLFLDDVLLVGAEYVITLTFSGTMNPPTNGFGLYWGSYDDLNTGQTR
jgi:aminopeptidase N